MNVFDLTLEEFNAHVYDFASRVATWDLIGIRDEGLKYLNKIPWKSKKLEDGFCQVKPESCVEATGFNIISLKNWTAGEMVTAELVGLPDEPGYNSSGDASTAGWTIGFAGLSKDGKTRLYSPSSVTDDSLETSVSWEIPADCEKLWAVVACTPSEYFTHGWDENNTNDIHWPYKVRFNGANI